MQRQLFDSSYTAATTSLAAACSFLFATFVSRCRLFEIMHLESRSGLCLTQRALQVDSQKHRHSKSPATQIASTTQVSTRNLIRSRFNHFSMYDGKRQLPSSTRTYPVVVTSLAFYWLRGGKLLYFVISSHGKPLLAS